ncbi:type IV secretion protein Rhs [Niastella caeni]|uniref:Type IV secretion protein Rhs n=1 Tax=Niastella caeni TaxID=2569763 RepID=A0A4S8HYY6_9BACT|nr:RHS repeat-associated core domain-containing protein [Niastella caeni]THU38462.1 type IV secretion protein Rhs [Niastella caeni]
MYVANTHLKPVIGIDIHFVNLPFPFVPLPHPYIGLVIDPFDYLPFIGATVKVNHVPRGNTDTAGMIITFVHIPFGAGFTLIPMIGHDSQNFFGSKKVHVDGAPMSGAGYMLMTCNDIGLPLSFRPGKKFKPIPSLYLPTSFCIPLQWGKPVMVGGPLVPNFSLMALLKAFAFGSFLKIFGKAGGKMLKALNHKVLKKSAATQKLSNRLCKMGFEPVDLITGRVNYECVDFELPGPVPVKWVRTWDSDSSITGPLGHGVQLSYDRCVQLWSQEECLSVTMADGRQVVFPLLYLGENFYHPQEKILLHRKQNGHFLLEDYNESLYYHFNHETQANTWHLSYIENYSGNRIQLHYTDKHLNAITDSAGRLLLFKLDKQHRIIQAEVKHRGLQQTLVSYTYNEEGDLVTITDALDQSTSIEYRYHLMIKKTDRNGQSYYWEYDSKRRCIHTWGDGGVLEGFIQYKKGYNIVINSLDENSIYYYDENNLCVRQVDHYGNQTYTEYTDTFDLYREIDEEGNITGYAYDEYSRLKEKTLPDGTRIQFNYNEHNQPTLIVNADGSSKTFGYDAMRRLRFVNHPNGKTIAYEYNAAGRLAAIIESGNRKTIMAYDEDDNLQSVQLPDNATASWKYDALGRCIQATNVTGETRRFEYDPLNRVRKLYLPDGNKINLSYNAYEEVTHAADKHHNVQFEYTPLGNVKIRRQHNTELRFIYDTEERLRAIVNEAGRHYSFGYNKRGEIISETRFDGLQRQYERDAAGKVIKTLGSDGSYKQFKYDANGRVIRKEYHDGSWEIFNYDKNGNLKEAINEHSTVRFSYNKLGFIEKEEQNGYIVQNTYNKWGSRIRVNSSLGADIQLQRNVLELVTDIQAAVSSPGESEAASWQAHIKYDKAGRETARLLPGKLTSEWQYDRAGKPAAHKVSRDEVVQSWKKYTWNANDRLTDVFDALSQGNTGFKHDAWGNLVFAQYADNSIVQRATDATGNVYTTKERSDRKYSAAGALLESDQFIYKYDNEGNLISKTDKTTNKKTRYVWYANGMLKKVLRPDGKSVEFTYDALGRRIEKRYGGKITRWIWNGNVPLHEWSYAENEKPVAVVDEWGELKYDKEEPKENIITWVFNADSFVPAAKIENNETFSIISDHLGTPCEAYNETGKRVWELVLDIYGRARVVNGEKNFIPFRYQGQYADEETGLHYNRFRYYSPEEGTFIAQDPIGLQGGLALYAYVNDPNAWVDILGLTPGAPATTWNAFQSQTTGWFGSRQEAAVGWKVYKESSQSVEELAIGRLPDTEAAEQIGMRRLNTKGWTPAVNDAWVQGGIDANKTFYLASDNVDANRTNPPGSKFPKTVFDRELNQLDAAKYKQDGNYMKPPAAACSKP